MPAALPRPATRVDHSAASTLAGLITHLDTVYAFAHALTSDAERASALTEQVYSGVTRDLWSTLGGHSLRDRLLARCLSIFNDAFRELDRGANTGQSAPDVLDALAALPLDDRAAIALVDRLGLTYAAGAAVLGMPVEEFRTTLHRARGALLRHCSRPPAIGALDSAR